MDAHWQIIYFRKRNIPCETILLSWCVVARVTGQRLGSESQGSSQGRWKNYKYIERYFTVNTKCDLRPSLRIDMHVLNTKRVWERGYVRRLLFFKKKKNSGKKKWKKKVGKRGGKKVGKKDIYMCVLRRAHSNLWLFTLRNTHGTPFFQTSCVGEPCQYPWVHSHVSASSRHRVFECQPSNLLLAGRGCSLWEYHDGSGTEWKSMKYM